MEVTITDLDHYGRGIAKVDNKVIFVDNALVGEEVLIEITKNHKNYSEARVIEYIKTSPKRVVPACKYYNECGGCSIMHMDYNEQLKFKKDKVKNILNKYAKINIPIEIIESNNSLKYRNKITLHSKNNNLGLYKKNSNNIVPIGECIICDDTINKLIPNLKTDKKVVIRTNNLNEYIITNENEEFIKEINNIKYKLNINSFFQVNDNVCSKLINYVKENIKESKNVLDLFCGVGTFSIAISDSVNRVLGVEVNHNAYLNSLKNIILNKVSNVEFKECKVENILEELTNEFDTIILDPPRSGLDNKTINYLLETNINKIIYISCDPITLARDLNKLRNNYNIETIKLFDMFPNTYHVETVCILKHKI